MTKFKPLPISTQTHTRANPDISLNKKLSAQRPVGQKSNSVIEKLLFGSSSSSVKATRHSSSMLKECFGIPNGPWNPPFLCSYPFLPGVLQVKNAKRAGKFRKQRASDFSLNLTAQLAYQQFVVNCHLPKLISVI